MLIGLDPLLGPDLLQALRAMGHGPSAQRAIRFSLGADTARDEIERVIDVVPRVVGRLRAVARAGLVQRVFRVDAGPGVDQRLAQHGPFQQGVCVLLAAEFALGHHHWVGIVNERRCR